MSNFSLAAFKSFLMTFDNLTIMPLGVELFAFIQLGVHLTSWMCRFMFSSIWEVSSLAQKTKNHMFSLICGH
jgi:hypothetical protein